MEYFGQYLFFIHFCIISIHLNNFSSYANPLIGATVTRAQDNEFPSVVSLATVPATNESDHYCTGTLISKKHVLTCAHCVESIDPSERSWKIKSNILVTVGSTDATRGIKHRVAGWWTFSEWATEKNVTVNSVPHLIHDIAVVTLTKQVNNIKPASLSTLTYADIVDKTVVAAGWGLLTDSGDEPRFLHRTDLRVIDKESCSGKLNDYNLTDDILNHFCTVGKFQAISLACGDSGGPIFINDNELVGVSDSVCFHYGHPSLLNLHLLVKIYKKFIEAVIDPTEHGVQGGVYNINNVDNHTSMCS